MSRSPLNTKRRSRKKRRKTRRKRRRRRSITTSTTTMAEVRRSRCRTARWRRRSPCRSVSTLRLAACAPAHVSSAPRRLAVPALTPARLSFSPCQITDCSLKTPTSRWWVLTEPRDSFLFILIPVLTPTNSCCCTAFNGRAAGTVFFNTADWPRFNDLKTFFGFSIIEVDVVIKRPQVCLIDADGEHAWSSDVCAQLLLRPRCILRSRSLLKRQFTQEYKPNRYPLTMPLKWMKTAGVCLHTHREQPNSGASTLWIWMFSQKTAMQECQTHMQMFFSFSSLPLF